MSIFASIMVNNELYVAPETNVVELNAEGIICDSGTLQDYTREDAQDW